MTSPDKTFLTSTATSVEALTVLIERSAIDITADYGDWCNIGFALAHEFGADGESFFLRISSFYPKYDPSEASKQYAACLRAEVPSGKAPITIATLFHIAKSHGINLPCPPLRGGAQRAGESIPPLRGGQGESFSSRNASEESEESEENARQPLPAFSHSIRSNLPSIMQRIVEDSSSDVDADILILGSLTVFSACIPNVYGVYDRREVFANLFLFVTARASAGKGRLSLCRHLAAPLHQALHDKHKKLLKKYEAAQAAYVVSRKKGIAVPPKEPPFLTLFLPANSTATVVYQTLAQNDGVGLLFETEGDTLANAFNSDLGNYSDGFRKAFHHETISYLRKKDHEYVEILRPKFSAVLSGTRQQIYSLIPNAENGLFSRFIFYSMQTELVWRDMFPTIDGATADERFRQIGKDFYTFLKDFPKDDVQFTLSYTQKQRFNDFFDETQRSYAYSFGDDIVASVRRLGLILFRIAMILSVLRLMDSFPAASKTAPLSEVKKSKRIVCTDIDFQSALDIVKVLLLHTVEVYQSLPRHSYERLATIAPKGSRQLAEASRSRFLDALPNSFDRPTYIEVAASLNITDKTAERYIREFCTSGQLDHPSNGQYLKTSSRA